MFAGEDYYDSERRHSKLAAEFRSNRVVLSLLAFFDQGVRPYT